MPLDGLWLRAPYLHNGSVPTLRDLLEPAAQRPAEFYRGNDLYDPVRMGFVAMQPAHGERHFFKVDTRAAGNSNARTRRQGLWHRADGAGEERAARIPEDLLMPGSSAAMTD